MWFVEFMRFRFKKTNTHVWVCTSKIMWAVVTNMGMDCDEGECQRFRVWEGREIVPRGTRRGWGGFFFGLY